MTPRSASPRIFPAVVFLALATSSAPAHADIEGKPGRISRIRVNTPGSEAHPSYLGAVVLKLTGTGKQVEYRWGGSSCPGQKLNDRQVEMLMTAFVERGRIRVAPSYTAGEGPATRCLVGFELSAG